ncbi:hypothetical protein H5410_061421 [Solanum commersonii]|uniref:Uncharacterized protein n=1 Tax=Solanum commersonii TaxID=4109 RepID=A0A9J5W8K1_SOLCO|nr:hypothetical protein H5410_061421 [Solanum commersonii]
MKPERDRSANQRTSDEPRLSTYYFGSRGHRRQQTKESETIIDPRIVREITLESWMKFVETVEKYKAEYGADRPTMGNFLWNLEYICIKT